MFHQLLWGSGEMGKGVGKQFDLDSGIQFGEYKPTIIQKRELPHFQLFFSLLSFLDEAVGKNNRRCRRKKDVVSSDMVYRPLGGRRQYPRLVAESRQVGPWGLCFG
jgi:hypothetical protein